MKNVNGTKDENLKIAIVGAGLVSQKSLSYAQLIHERRRFNNNLKNISDCSEVTESFYKIKDFSFKA